MTDCLLHSVIECLPQRGSMAATYRHNVAVALHGKEQAARVKESVLHRMTESVLHSVTECLLRGETVYVLHSVIVCSYIAWLCACCTASHGAFSTA